MTLAGCLFFEKSAFCDSILLRYGITPKKRLLWVDLTDKIPLNTVHTYS